MIRVASDPFDQISRFLEYPVEGLRQELNEFPATIRDRFPAAAESLEVFLKATQDLSLTDMEELFTRTFDINPACNLELGWILYGQQYERGAFLVRMRELLREHGVEERGELPDHLTYVMRALAKMPEDEAKTFCAKEVLPALEKMREGFSELENPYASVLEAVQSALILFAEHDLPSSSEAGK